MFIAHQLLAGISLPVLEEAEIRLFPEYPEPLTCAEGDAIFRQALPLLNASGKLSIVSDFPSIYTRTHIKMARRESVPREVALEGKSLNIILYMYLLLHS